MTSKAFSALFSLNFTLRPKSYQNKGYIILVVRKCKKNLMKFKAVEISKKDDT